MASYLWKNMQIICTQSGKKPFFGTWWNLTEGPNPLPHWSVFTLLLSTLESLVLPSLNNSTRAKSEVDFEDVFDDLNRRFVRRINTYEIKEALKRMKINKSLGPDIPIEVSAWEM